MSSPARTVSLTKDATGAPAVDLSKVRETNPDLAKIADKAGMALSKRNLSGIRAQGIMLLDHSGSMYDDFASGAIQQLVSRVLAFMLQTDADGTVPVIPFDSMVKPSVDVTQANFSSVVQDSIWKPRNMGTTNLADALVTLKRLVEDSDLPVLGVVVTDGNPDHRPQTTRIVQELASYPVFLKFLALRPVAYLSELDDLPPGSRLLDNVDTKPEMGTGLNLLTCTDAEFVDALADEWDTWITAATAAGLLKV